MGHDRVIESIGSDQILYVSDELVHRFAPEVVLGQFRSFY